MEWNFLFFLNSAALGVGLAMDAFSVSMANGLNESNMSRKKIVGIAGTFGFFQWLMPMLGWIAVHTIAEIFTSFQKLIPWIALILLGYIGGGMLKEGITKKEAGDAEKESRLGKGELFVQGIATSIDALSVGFTIASYDALHAFTAALIIAVVTFFISYAGVYIGRRFGMKLADKASILGGIILIAIGIEIFASNLI